MSEDPELSLNAAVHRIGPKVNVVPDTLRGWTKPGSTVEPPVIIFDA